MIKIIIIIFLTAILLGIFIWGNFTNKIADSETTKSESRVLNSIGLGGPNEIGQSFIATQNNLTRIDLEISKTKNVEGGFIFHLKNSPYDKIDIYSETHKVDELGIDGFFTFNFPKIKNSKNKKYYFSIESLNIPDNQTLYLVSNTDTAPQSINYYVDNNISSNYNLSYKVFDKQPIKDFFLNYLNRLIDDKSFFLFYLGIILLTLIGFVINNFSNKTNKVKL